MELTAGFDSAAGPQIQRDDQRRQVQGAYDWRCVVVDAAVTHAPSHPNALGQATSQYGERSSPPLIAALLPSAARKIH